MAQRRPRVDAAADAAPRSDAVRRGEQRQLLVELELDDAVFVPGGQRGGYFPASEPSRAASGSGRRPQAASSPARQHSSRLSSPYKLKHAVLSSRKATADASGDDLDEQTRGTGRRSSSRPDSAHASDRGRQRRASGASKDSRANPAALVRDAIRQNMRWRDQALVQLRDQVVPPAIAVPRARSTELGVPPSLVRELNKLRALSLAVVEMVVYLYSESAAKARAGSKDRRRRSRVDVEGEQDAEALEREFFPYLLRMAAADTDFLALSPGLQRFFDAQCVGLSRNPFLDGLALDASELLLCSCNYVSASSSPTLFNSASTLASSSSSSLFQLLTHKLEAFALQTERYLPGWQVLPCDRVATALLHLLELETRSNAARLLPTYLRPSLSREASATSGSPSASSISRQDPMSASKLDKRTEVVSVDSPAEPRNADSKVTPSTPPQARASPAHQAWDASVSEAVRMLPPVTSFAPGGCSDPQRDWDALDTTTDSPILFVSQGVAAELEASTSARSGELATVSSEPKRVADSHASTRLFKKNSGVQKVGSPRTPTHITSQPTDSVLHASGKLDVGLPESAVCAIRTADSFRTRDTPDDARCESYQVISLPSESGGVIAAGTNAAEASLISSDRQDLLLAPRIALVGDGDSSSTKQGDDFASAAGEGRPVPIIPRLSLDRIALATVETEDDHHELACLYHSDDGRSTVYTTVPCSSRRNSDFNSTQATPGSHADRRGVEGRSTSPITATEPGSALTGSTSSSERCSLDKEFSPHDANPSLGLSTARSDLSVSFDMPTSVNPSARSQSTPASWSYRSISTPDGIPSALLSMRQSQRADQGTAELYPSSSVTSHIAKALDLLPRFDSIGSTINLETDVKADGDFRSGRRSGAWSSHSCTSTRSGDYGGVAIDQTTELQSSQRSRTESQTQPSLNARSAFSRSGAPDPRYEDTNRSRRSLKTSEDASTDSLDRIFNLCRDVQVTACDLGHRFSEIEVDRSYELIPPQFFSPLRSGPRAPVQENDAPRYLERELKVLRRHFGSWRENARQQRIVKRRLRRAAAQRTIQRFGVQCVALRHERLAEQQRERQHAAAQVLQQLCVRHIRREAAGRRSGEFHLVHRCFYRLRFFAGTSKRRRRREEAKEAILRCWRRCQSRIRRIKKRQDALRKQRERREHACRVIKQATREWILRRRLARAQVEARKALFKDNLKWTKSKREHEKTLRFEHRRQTQWTSMMRENMAELESKWKSAESERVALQTHYDKVVERYQRTVDTKRREIAAHKIRGFLATCALRHKLLTAETTRSRTDEQLRLLDAKTRRADQETERWRQKMRLEQRLLERKLAKAEKRMAIARSSHDRDMQTRLSIEQQLQHEVARRTIKSFVDRRCLEWRAQVDQQRQRVEQSRLRVEKRETEAMAAEDLLAHDRGARSMRSLLENRLAVVHREAEQQLATRDLLLRSKDDQVQRAEQRLEQQRLEASRSRLNVWLTQQVRVSRVKKQADAALTAAARAMEAEKQRQAELLACQSREVATLKIGAFVTNRVERRRVQRHEAASQRRQAEVYAKGLVTEQRLRSFVVEMVISVKLQSEREAHASVVQAVRGVQELGDFLTRRRVRLHQLRRAAKARAVQRSWRQWSARQQLKREERARALQRVAAVQQRESARCIQRRWRRYREQRDKRAIERERKLQRVDAVRRRESARRVQRAWRGFADRKKLQRAERQRQLKRLERVRRRESARHIQAAWRRHAERERRRLQERERARLRVEGVRRRESARRIQSAWLAAAKRKRQARETRERQLRTVRLVQRRESAKRIQSAWRAHLDRRRAQHERLRRLKERVRSTRRRESARKIQRAWRMARLRRYEARRRLQMEQLERAELERKSRRTLVVKQRECARKIAVAWRTARLRELQLRLEHEGLADRRQRVAAVRERESARHIQRTWRRHSGQRRDCHEGMDLRVLQADAIKRRECARQIQCGWRFSRERRREMEEEEAADRARMHRRLEELRSAQGARVVQRGWREWRQLREADRMRDECLSLLRTRRAARRIQSHWRCWRVARKATAEAQALAHDASARAIQLGFARWMDRKRRGLELQALLVAQSVSVTRIQRVYRQWRGRARESAASMPAKVDSATRQEGAASSITKRVSSRRIIRAWRRFRNVSQFAAATRIGAVWRGRCARQAFALALDSKRAQAKRLDEIRLSILAVRVQRCYQAWRVRVRRRRRAEMLARECEIIAEARRLAKKESTRWRAPVVGDDQKQSVALDCMESACGPDLASSDAGGSGDMTQHDEDVTAADIRAVVGHWATKELPYILTTGVRAMLVMDAAAAVLQRFSRDYRRRARLWFHTKRSPLLVASDLVTGATDAEFRFFFKHASAWLEWHRPQDSNAFPTSTLRLRFEAQVTRKLLVMLDRQAHSVDEIRHAVTEIATDALPIFASDECARSHEATADRDMPYHDVGELELPHFCALTRSMGKIRSMHRRQQHSASFRVLGKPPSNSLLESPRSASIRPRAQSLTVFEAVENASVEDAMFLQSLGEDLGAIEPKMMRNALHLLTFSSENYRFRLEMLDFLLQDGNADVNAMDINGETPAMLFAAHGHLEFLSRVAKHGADLQLTDRNGRNVLHRACEEDQVEIIAFLHRSVLPVSPLDLHVPDQSGQYPLHIAASKGLAECAKQLLSNDTASSWSASSSERWEDILQSHRDSQGRTPLHIAVLLRDIAMVSLLLTLGGEHVVNDCDDMRRSAVHFAVEGSPSPLNAASTPVAATDVLAILTMLIDHGANTNIGDERGDTPLHWAAFAGNVPLVRFLVARGADTTAVNSDWESPAQVAAAYGHAACVKAMGTSPHHRNSQGTTDFAAESGGSDSERTTNEVVNELAFQQASSQSYRVPGASHTSAQVAASVENHYWEEIHQEVELVDESGRFSSEDESGYEEDDSAADVDT